MKILVVDSSENLNMIFKDLLDELESKDFSFYFLCSEKKILDQYASSKRNVKKVYLGPASLTKSRIIFFIIYPYLFLSQLLLVTRLKRKKKIKAILSINLNEKIIFSPIARILKIKNIWIEYPAVDYKNRVNIFKKLYKYFFYKATIITFLNLTSARLKACLLGRDCENNNLKTIPIGIKIGKSKRQESIFSSLAKGEQSNFSKKYFTIGTVLNTNQTSNIEVLFLAVKLCLDVIPSLQIILVDENIEKNDLDNKKKIDWLAKKMGIESIVWYVQESVYINKWLDSFDIFVVINDAPSIENLRIITNAMASGLPIIAQRNYGLEDLVVDGKTGFLLEARNSNILAERIISLFKNKLLINNLGKEGIKIIKEKHKLECMVSKFEKIFKN